MNPKKINGHTLPQFIAFLNETLIPDLKKSGTTCTAEDFESAVKWIEFVGDQHNAALATLKKLRDAAVNTPALDSSKDWTGLIEEADRVLGARVGPAPELLAITKKLVSWADTLRRSAGIEPDAKEPLVADIKEARAAIAKATP